MPLSWQEIKARAATRAMFRKECVICIFLQTGEQPENRRALTVCFEHGSHSHPDVRKFFNEGNVA